MDKNMNPIISSPELHLYYHAWLNPCEYSFLCDDFLHKNFKIPDNAKIRCHLYKKCTDSKHQIKIQLRMNGDFVFWRIGKCEWDVLYYDLERLLINDYYRIGLVDGIAKSFYLEIEIL